MPSTCLSEQADVSVGSALWSTGPGPLSPLAHLCPCTLTGFGRGQFLEVGVEAKPHCSLPKAEAVADCCQPPGCGLHPSKSSWMLSTLVSGYMLQFRPSPLFQGFLKFQGYPDVWLPWAPSEHWAAYMQPQQQCVAGTAWAPWRRASGLSHWATQL